MYENIDENIDENIESAVSDGRLRGITVTVNPYNPESVDKLLGRVGPEGLYEIADILKRAADKDVEGAYYESIKQ